MSHREIARKFARFNAFGEGRSMGGGSQRVTYHDSKAFSYQTCVARIVNGSDSLSPLDRKVALISSEKYSPSTGTHIRLIDSALDAVDMMTFRVPYIGARGGWNGDDTVDVPGSVSMAAHEGNVAWYRDTVAICVANAERLFRSDDDAYSWGWRDSLRTLCDNARNYMDVFGLTEVAGIHRSTFNAEPLVVKIQEVRAAKMDAYMHPSKVRARERARARRLLKLAMLEDCNG